MRIETLFLAVLVSSLLCGVFSQESRTIRHAWAPSGYVGRAFSWTLQWKGLDPSGQAIAQSALPPGITFNAAGSRFEGTFSGSAPSSYDTNLTFSSLSFGSSLTLQVHFTFFPSTGYAFRDPNTLPSFTSLGPHRPRVVSETLVLSPALTNQYIPIVAQNNPYTRNESIEFYFTTVSSTNVVVSFPDNLPPGQRAPILLWMHGNSYYGEYYIETMKVAASHGIAMVAPNYLAWSVGTNLVQQRTRLLNQALDFVYAMNNNVSSPWFNKLDVTSGFVVGGHSWGGATASLYSLERRGGVRGSILMDEIAMINNPEYYRRQDGLNTTVPFWYNDPTPFGEMPMLYFRAPRSSFDEGIAEGTAAYTSSPFTTVVSVTDAFHESFLDAYPAQIVDVQVANSSRQTAAHFIVAFMKRVVNNDLSMTDYLLGPASGILSSRTAPFTSFGVDVTTTDRSTQLLIEDFGRIGVNNLGNPTRLVSCNNRTLPGLNDVLPDPQRTNVVTQSAWQWIYMNVTNSSTSVSFWETQLGVITDYSEYKRVCVDLMLTAPPASGTFVRFPQDLLLTFGFNFSSTSSIRLVAGQNFDFSDLQIRVLRPVCLPLSTFANPIVAISVQLQIATSSQLSSVNLFMDRVRLERNALPQLAPVAAAPIAPPTTASQPQSIQAPMQSQAPSTSAQQPQMQQGPPTAATVPSRGPTANSQTNSGFSATLIGSFGALILLLMASCTALSS